MTKVIQLNSTDYGKRLIKMNGKYYIELEEKGNDYMAELAISLATEVDILRERVQLMQEKLKSHEENF